MTSGVNQNMEFNKPLIAEIIVGALAMVLGVIFIMAAAQPVANAAISSTSSNWAAYTSAASLVALVPLFNAILPIILASAVAIGFLKAVGLM
jgi:hypothetical protein